MNRFNLVKKSSKHLKSSNENYISHLFWASYAGIKMIVVGISSIVHGFIPAFFTGTAAKTIIDFYHERLVDHPNKEYTDYISKKSEKN
jgi:predicted nucleotidyltransferase component of viral defense system